jgi:hypothetical protein
MVMLCRMPGGLLHRDPPDHQKGMELSSTPRNICGHYLCKRQSENILRHKCIKLFSTFLVLIGSLHKKKTKLNSMV